MKRTPQQFENDYFPGWAVSKKHASPEMLERLERFIAEKRALCEVVAVPRSAPAACRGRAASAELRVSSVPRGH
jgi:hypothetical protein